MKTVTISLPESLKEFIDDEVVAGDFGTVSEYLRSLLRQDRKQKAQARLEDMLLEGLESAASEMTPEDWLDVRREVRARHKARAQKTD
jgi:antitoxin ParD1/3/4